MKKIKPKITDKVPKKRLLSKYKRKTANAKERDRMKKMNDVFATLKSVIPVDGKIDKEEEKETKVTTLRSAIHYINYLKQLIEECDAGLVDKNEFGVGEDERNSEPNIEAKQKFASQKSTKPKEKIPKLAKSKSKS